MQRSSWFINRLTPAVFMALLVTVVAGCSELAAPYDEAVAPYGELARFSKAASPAGFFPLDLQVSDSSLCAAHGGFPVETVLSGNLKIASMHQRSGTVRVVEILANGRITLTANGRTLGSPIAGTVFYELDAQDNLTGVTFVGLNGVFTVPRLGRIAVETGRLVIDGNGSITFESGPHDVFGSSPNVAGLCGYLGS